MGYTAASARKLRVVGVCIRSWITVRTPLTPSLGGAEEYADQDRGDAAPLEQRYPLTQDERRESKGDKWVRAGQRRHDRDLAVTTRDQHAKIPRCHHAHWQERARPLDHGVRASTALPQTVDPEREQRTDSAVKRHVGVG